MEEHMPNSVDLYDSTYGNFREKVLAEIRRETFGEDIGQNSWITVDEYDTFYGWLGLVPGARLLEVASGSGGPSLYLARKFGCRVTGVDINEEGLAAARKAAEEGNVAGAEYRFADMDTRLPFDNDSFDALMCIDSMNHFRNRRGVLEEWRRILKPGGRILFTDPVVITGTVSSEELAARSSIGFFLFVPLEETKQHMSDAGFHLLRCEDVTRNIELTSGRWLDARARHKEALMRIEGEERFEGLQRFMSTVHSLARERRLSRFVFVGEKQAAR